MNFNKSILPEENLVIEILFGDKKLKKNTFLKIDYERFIKIISSQLLIPSIFINLKRKRCLSYFPKDFISYLEEIYLINRNRNIELISEANQISQKLLEKKINYVFLKGTAHLFSNLYKDIGERMIGDIDILVNKMDLDESIRILKDEGYYDIEYSFFENMHYTRQIHREKIFAVEVHTKLLDLKNEKFIKSRAILNNRIKSGKIYTPSFTDQLYHNIYNFQINDFGSKLLLYNIRSYYDSFLIKKKENVIIKTDKLDLNINRYFQIANFFKIPEMVSNNYLKSIRLADNKSDYIRFILLRNSNIFRKLNYLIFRQLELLPKQIKEFCLNKKYRIYIFKKLKKS